MKRGKALGTFFVLVCLVFAGVYARRFFSGHSHDANWARSSSGTRALKARAKAADTSKAPGQSEAKAPQQTALNPRLFQTPSTLWNKPIPEEAFARFHDWVEKSEVADPATKATLESEGVELAKARRAALAELIRSDPERALELAVPMEVREQLPSSIVQLLEEQVSGRGRLAVLGALAEPGKEDEVTPTFRTASIDGQEYQAFVYGWRLGQPTRDSITLNGIAVNNLLAVSENPLRILGPAEAAAAKKRASDPICAISGAPSSSQGQEVVGEVGGQPVFFCSGIHAQELNNRLIAADGGAAGSAGAADQVAPSTWTEGLKKLIVIRVDFSDLVGVPMSDATGISLISGLNDFYSEMSYGRAGYYTNGAGSDLTPTFRMPQPAAYYGTNNYYDQLRADAQSAATAAGYNVSSYDRDVICMGAVPGWGWAGLGYVGAAGAWLRSYFTPGVAGHELGHNEGLNHANFWDTSSQSIIGPGTSVEYGDIYDTMGQANAGAYHFNARYKSYLNWLTTNETLTVTSNGTYRIYAHDDATSTGLRGLRIVKWGTTNYWVEFRQKFTGNKWLMSGAGLRWAQNGNERSQLLDTTPGTSDGKNDAAIVIGRTFNDYDSGIHITPIGKGGTSPESLDVVVNLGSFPGNLPPTVSVTPSGTSAAVGATLTFTATTSDPNGDTLAYYWDFGDGNFGSNSPSASKSWSSAGEYVVRCVVTDMKGGEASKSVIVTIGTPNTYRISGQVTSASGPVENVRISASTPRITYTDSDGTYTIVGLGAGTYTVSAVLENYILTNSDFVNPVTVGPNATNIDFLATYSVSSPPTIVTQPASQTANIGSTVSFNVSATGSVPMSYQWRFNGANISGATGTSYSKSNVQAVDAGNYSVVVSNALGTVASANAVLTVNTPPAITTQPQSQTVIGGNSATFTVTATGASPLNYQWRLNDTNISAATNTSYTRSNVQLADGGNYSVLVTNSLGSVTSAPATLTVNFTLNATATTGGSVTKNPNQQSYAANTVVTLTATSTSSWPFTSWSGDATGTNNPLSVTLNSNKNITANFTSPVADSIVDNPAATFSGTWSTATSASDKYGADYRTAASTQGASSSFATFTPNVTTAGTYDVYAWFPTITKGSTTSPFQISGATTNFTVTVNQSVASGGWQLLATGVNFASGTNGFVRLGNGTGQNGKNVAADAVRWSYSLTQTVVAPVVSAQPQPERVMEGTPANFSVSAGGSQPLTFQWRLNAVPIAGATNSSLALAAVHASDAGGYDVSVSNFAGQVSSAAANLTVSLRPTLSCAPAISNGVARLNLNGTIGDRYLIQISTNLLNWSNSITITNLTGTTQFTDTQATNYSRRFYRCLLLP